MSSLVSKDKGPKFLLLKNSSNFWWLSKFSEFWSDENVKKELLQFLKKDFDVIFKPKRLDNGKLAEFSKSEQRIFVTNDWDFTNESSYNKETIFSIVWLRISQSKPETLLKEFSKLLKEIKPEEFKGKLITLYEDRFEVSKLA